MIVLDIAGFVVITIVVVVLHELFHWVPAKLLGLSPEIMIKPFWSPSVSYKNNGYYGKILITTVAPSVLLVSIGFFLPSDHALFLYAKALCFINVLNFFPITADGEVLLVACAHLFGFQATELEETKKQ